MAALFACTKCHSRHPFEDLTKSEQLCKNCRKYQPVVKCTVCRVEYTPGVKGATNNNCRHCTYNLKMYGQPAVCQYCNLTAAFVDNKCVRCTSYEKKCGKPRPCEQCKMKCAFDSETSRKKVDGKLLCWLCALAYERVLEKARQKQEEKKQSLQCNASSFDKLDKHEKADKVENISTCSNTNSRDRFSPFDTNSQSRKTTQKDPKSVFGAVVNESQNKPAPTSFASSFDFLREHKEDKSNDSSEVKVKEECAMEKEQKHKHHHHHHHHHKSKHHKRSHSPTNSCSPSKRPKIENSDSNGITGSQTPTKTSTLSAEKSPVDPNSSEHIIAINRLQEQLDILKRQLALKDQQLLEKEKKITEVKAAQYESDKSYRAKLLEMAKKNVESVDLIQVRSNELERKNRDLKKQVELLSKGKKINLLSNSQNSSQNNSPSLSS